MASTADASSGWRPDGSAIQPVRSRAVMRVTSTLLVLSPWGRLGTRHDAGDVRILVARLPGMGGLFQLRGRAALFLLLPLLLSRALLGTLLEGRSGSIRH